MKRTTTPTRRLKAKLTDYFIKAGHAAKVPEFAATFPDGVIEASRRVAVARRRIEDIINKRPHA